MSRLPFELFLALRYLRPKRTFVSIITLISIVGVMLGVAVLIIVISVMTGFDQELRGRILAFNSHLRVVNRGGKLADYAGVSRVIAQNPKVTGVAPYVLGQVFMETQPEVGEPVSLAPYVRGVDPKLEEQVSVLPKSVVEGSFDLRGNRILIGREMADELRLRVGDHVDILSPRDLRKMKQSRTKADAEEVLHLAEDYTVAGIFDVGYYQYNEGIILTSLANAQDLFDLDESVNGLMVMIQDPYGVDKVRAELGPRLPDASISTWMEENSTFLNALLVEKKVMTYILFFIMIVAAFGITSALITFVVQKTREIGMLKALGATGAQILWLFLSQSLLVGVIGVISGFVFGMLALSYRNEFLHLMNRMTGFELFPAKIYNFSELPMKIIPGDIAVICGGSLIICILAGLLPAWSASRLKPVEALRYE